MMIRSTIGSTRNEDVEDNPQDGTEHTGIEFRHRRFEIVVVKKGLKSESDKNLRQKYQLSDFGFRPIIPSFLSVPRYFFVTPGIMACTIDGMIVP